MSTLKEAVESGRRWRWRYASDDPWSEWFPAGGEGLLTVRVALYGDFEIEPEPEKPREWRIRVGEYGPLVFQTHVPVQDLDYGKNAESVRVHDADACDRLRGKP